MFAIIFEHSNGFCCVCKADWGFLIEKQLLLALNFILSEGQVGIFLRWMTLRLMIELHSEVYCKFYGYAQVHDPGLKLHRISQVRERNKFERTFFAEIFTGFNVSISAFKY